MDFYTTMVFERGCTLTELDEMDIRFYFELMEHKTKSASPKAKKRKRNAQVVPINHVF